jgi:hypothetical protein
MNVNLRSPNLDEKLDAFAVTLYKNMWDDRNSFYMVILGWIPWGKNVNLYKKGFEKYMNVPLSFIVVSSPRMDFTSRASIQGVYISFTACICWSVDS